MEEIKIGEYIRTKKGTIAKVLAYYDLITYNDEKASVTFHSFDTIRGAVADIDIAKHSKNIIDLIEIGDYVNEEKVIALRGEDDCYYDVGTDFDDEYGNWFGYQKEEIRTILTKEQYKNNCFEVEEGQDV